jgi:hypothetical protein
VRELAELGVSLVEGQDRRSDPTGVRNALEQPVRCCVRRHDEHRLAPTDGLEAVETESEVRRCVARRSPAHKGGRELCAAGVPGLVIEVGREVPGLLLRCADQQESTGG